MSKPYLSIIIITLNEQKRLPLLLEDLKRQSYQDFEIIHVDSNSDDDTLPISRMWQDQFPHYTIKEMDRRGVSLGRNTGAELAQGQRLLFLDADTRLESHFLEYNLAELTFRRLDVGIVCMSSDGLPMRHRLGYELFNAGIRLTSLFFPTAVGACIFSTPAIHNKVYGFDERLSLCEDCNYVLKASKQFEARLGVLHQKFRFDPRRLEQDGSLATGMTYLRANLFRFFKGELYKNEIAYQFGHYGQGV